MKNLRLHQTHRIKMVVVDAANQFIEIKNYDITYTMFSVPMAEDATASSRNQNKAFLKVNFFLKSMLDGAIVYTPDQLDELSSVLMNYDNNYVVLPDTTDTTLLEAIHCKLNVLCGDTTFVDDISLTDVDNGIGYSMAVDSDDFSQIYGLPTSQDQWLPGHSFWEEPWWCRYDATTFDNYSELEEHVQEFRQTETFQGALVQDLQQIDEQVDALFNQHLGKTAEVISLDQIRADLETKKPWKPTLV
jgi:hypothetical protein